MKKITLVWCIGAVLNIALIGLQFFSMNFFEEKAHIPLLWVLINFLPLSILFAYYSYNKTVLTDKNVVRLLLLFLGLCLLSLLSRPMTSSYEGFEKTIFYAPFVLLALQAFLFTLILRIANVKNQLEIFLKAKNRDQIVGFIQRGKTEKALDILLEESEMEHKNVFKFLSLQKSNLITAKKKFLSNTIDDTSYQSTIAKVSQSILDLLLKE